MHLELSLALPDLVLKSLHMPSRVKISHPHIPTTLQTRFTLRFLKPTRFTREFTLTSDRRTPPSPLTWQVSTLVSDWLKGVVPREGLFGPLMCTVHFLITRTLTCLCSAESHYHNQARDDSYSITARKPGNTKDASFRLYRKLLHLIPLSIYHITNGHSLAASLAQARALSLGLCFNHQRCEEG